MTTELFRKYLIQWDNELARRKKKILLLIDNCPSHTNIPALSFIKVVFLPPNTTSVLQPMDQGIIKSIKTNFRKQLVLKFLQDVEESRPTKISILDAILMVTKAWNDVPVSTISNCYRHAGLMSAQDQISDGPQSENDKFVDWAQSIPFPPICDISQETLAHYTDIDKDLYTEYDEEEPLLPQPGQNEKDEEEDVESENEIALPPLVEILRSAQLVKKYLAFNEDMCNETMVKGIDEIEKHLSQQYYNNKCSKQTSITDFFSN